MATLLGGYGLTESRHGGNIYDNKIELDFSVNINPEKMPDSLKRAMEQSINYTDTYPDIHCKKLRKKIAEYHGIDNECIVCGNGASELLMAIAHGEKPDRILLMTPCFYGYEYVADAISAKFIFYELKRKNGFAVGEDFLECIDRKIDMVILTNPNNPTGLCIDKVLLEKIVDRCKKYNITVLLDECFIELSTHFENSMINKTEMFDNLIVLRAFTKSFAIPGVRLGYIVCSNKNKIKSIKRQLPEWNVSVVAQNVGIAALEERQYLKKSRELIFEEKKYLIKELDSLGFEVINSDANYLMFYCKTDLYNKLLTRGILIRNCDNYRGIEKGFLRIAVKTHSENQKLINAINEID